MRLTKPIYEVMPFFLIGVGILFVMLVLNRYEHAPTLVAWFSGLGCIIGGGVMLATRIHSRRQRARED